MHPPTSKNNELPEPQPLPADVQDAIDYLQTGLESSMAPPLPLDQFYRMLRQTQAVSETNVDPATVEIIRQHSISFQVRHIRTRDLNDLKASVYGMWVVVGFASSPNPMDFHIHTTVVNDLVQRTRTAQNLKLAIEAHLLAFRNLEDPEKILLLKQHARLLLARYYYNGNPTDLSQFIEIQRRVPAFTENQLLSMSPLPGRGSLLAEGFIRNAKAFSAALLIRFRLVGNSDDLDEAMKVLDEMPEEWQRGERYTKAARRFIYTGSMTDLELAVDLQSHVTIGGNEINAIWRDVDLANMYIDLGRREDALAVLKESCEQINMKSSRLANPVKMNIMAGLSKCYCMLGLTARAKTIAQTCLEEVCRIENISAHYIWHEYLETLTNIVECLSCGQLFNDAVKIGEQYLVHAVHNEPINSEEALAARAVLAFVDASIGKEGGEEMMEECLVQKTNINGREHIHTLRYMHQLALIYSIRKRPENALNIERDCYEIKARQLGPDHPETMESYEHLTHLEGRFQIAITNLLMTIHAEI